MIQYYHQVITRNPLGAEATIAELNEIWSRYGKEQVIASSRAIDFFRLGLNAGNASDLESAVSFLSRAIAQKPDYQEAYLYRGVTNNKKRNPTGVVSDTTEAWRLNAQARKILAKQKAARHKRDVIGQARDSGTEYYLNKWEALALQFRGSSYQVLGEMSKALEDGQKLIALRPKESSGYALAGFAQLNSGNVADALKNIEKAMDLETEPLKLKVLKDTLANIRK